MAQVFDAADYLDSDEAIAAGRRVACHRGPL
jgi:hypothetical protein